MRAHVRNNYFGDLDTAERWHREAAEGGNVESMRALGALFLQRARGRRRWFGGRRNREVAEAEQWYRKAAEAGDVEAMQMLGGLLHQRREHREAEQWYRKAIDGGDIASMNNLGVLLYERGAVPEAENWYRRAAANGSASAQQNLRKLLSEYGTRTEQWTPAARQQNPSPAIHPRPTPTPRPSTPPAPDNNYRILLNLVMGVPATAEQLIEFERTKAPMADRTRWINEAIDRLRQDRFRQG